MSSFFCIVLYQFYFDMLDVKNGGNMYNNVYSAQANIERINNQIAELERIKSQLPQPIQQPTNLTQNFQLAPSNQGLMRYATSIDEVNKEVCYVETPYFSKDMSVVWIKNAKGEVKTFELTEIVPKDAKDIQIEYLQAQINELKKGMVKNEQPIADADYEQVSTDTSRSYGTTREPIKKEKSSSVQTVPASKKK